MPQQLDRRSYLKAAGVGGLMGLAGCTGLTGGGGDDTLKIGAVLPLSGALATYGEKSKVGMAFVEQQLGGKILDKEYEVVSRDTKTQPSTGLQKTKELVEQENVDALMGIGSSATAISIAPYLKDEAKLPFSVLNGSSPAIRENSKYCTEYWFFPFTSSRQMALPHAQFITNVLPEQVDGDLNQQVAYIYSDYEAGQEALEMFKTEFENAGGSVPTEVPVPPGTKDFSNYLPKLENSDADVVHAFLPGAMGVQFATQAADFGLKDEKTMALSGDVFNQLSLAAIGDAANGMYGTHWYNSLNDSQLNADYKNWHEENHDTPPNSIVVSGVNMLYSLAMGMEQVGSSDPGDVVDAMSGMNYESPMGELTYRAGDHQTKLNYFGFEIADGWYDSLEQYPDVIGPANCSL